MRQMHEDIYDISGTPNPSKDKAWRVKIKRGIIANFKITSFWSVVILKALKSRKETTKKDAIQK